jgi:hypothetical protein
MKILEFWPDYSGALLWSDNGKRVSLDDVPLPRDLIEQAYGWIAEYDDSKLPWEPTRDDEWLSEGKRLFVDLRRELLKHGFDLAPDEDFWAPRDGVDEVQPGESGGR